MHSHPVVRKNNVPPDLRHIDEILQALVLYFPQQVRLIPEFLPIRPHPSAGAAPDIFPNRYSAISPIFGTIPSAFRKQIDMKTIFGIIPARFASTRFPGKPLAEIGGISMIRRVYTQAKKSQKVSDIIVATDDARIVNEVKSFGGRVCLTSPDHPSGTDRCAEVLESLHLECDAIVNIQGDEPFIDPRQIDLLCSCFDDARTELATLIKEIDATEILFNPNSPKVIVDKDGFAIYFSRHPIPFIRGMAQDDWVTSHKFYQHIGIYGYRPAVLRAITNLHPSALEKAESLEQLRWIENGFRIKTAATPFETIAIDTPEDLDRIVASLNQSKPDHTPQ
jgi:3-deoxy-manno-octulosonate cytidylyltransferase (CMP-KDO synthetase)